MGRAMEQCTTGETCQGTCNTRGLRLECPCAGGGQFLCAAVQCPTTTDGRTDGGTPTCPAGTSTGDNCDPQTDEVCDTTCSATTRMNLTCPCPPTGGGNRARCAVS